jgi:hypothetical protein
VRSHSKNTKVARFDFEHGVFVDLIHIAEHTSKRATTISPLQPYYQLALGISGEAGHTSLFAFRVYETEDLVIERRESGTSIELIDPSHNASQWMQFTNLIEILEQNLELKYQASSDTP